MELRLWENLGYLLMVKTVDDFDHALVIQNHPKVTKCESRPKFLLILEFHQNWGGQPDNFRIETYDPFKKDFGISIQKKDQQSQ